MCGFSGEFLGKGVSVKYNVSGLDAERIRREIMDYFRNNKLTPEGIGQDDHSQLNAIELVSKIADIIRFDVVELTEHDDETGFGMTKHCECLTCREKLQDEVDDYFCGMGQGRKVYRRDGGRMGRMGQGRAKIGLGGGPSLTFIFPSHQLPCELPNHR